mgnify:CR=1 FL=1
MEMQIQKRLWDLNLIYFSMKSFSKESEKIDFFLKNLWMNFVEFEIFSWNPKNQISVNFTLFSDSDSTQLVILFQFNFKPVVDNSFYFLNWNWFEECGYDKGVWWESCEAFLFKILIRIQIELKLKRNLMDFYEPREIFSQKAFLDYQLLHDFLLSFLIDRLCRILFQCRFQWDFVFIST